jgi:hypothetical protein
MQLPVPSLKREEQRAQAVARGGRSARLEIRAVLGSCTFQRSAREPDGRRTRAREHAARLSPEHAARLSPAVCRVPWVASQRRNGRAKFVERF